MTLRVRQKNYTPSARDAAALLEALGTVADDEAIDIERALLRTGALGLKLAAARLADAGPPLRGRLCRFVGRYAGPGPERQDAGRLLLRLLDDPDDKTRRNAVIALGRVPRTEVPEVEDALLAAWAKTARVDHRRSLAASLGKIGSERAQALLRELRTDDPELRRIAEQALLTLERTRSRTAAGRVVLDRPPPGLPRDQHIALHCRDGLEELLQQECPPGWRAQAAGPGRVRLVLRGPPAQLFCARTWLRFGWVLPAEPLAAGEDVADAVARVLSGASALAILRAYTEGPLRFRLAFTHGGHRRATVWRCARLLAATPLRNDPTGSPWEAVVDEQGRSVRVELRPRDYDDPRFAYRKRDVPAASHPTLAAALARIAGARDDDVVWDPFVGSGLELAERACLGRYRALYGTDLDPEALAAARENLAGVPDLHLLQQDARRFAPAGLSLVITNPPMGRRLLREGNLHALFDELFVRVGRALSPAGRMVWISPSPRHTAACARRAGLVPSYARDVDMGGFTAQIQAFRKLRG